MDVVEKFLESGNMYGKTDLQAGLDLSGAAEAADVLLYIGEVASVEVPEIAAAAMSLLKKAGVAYIGTSFAFKQTSTPLSAQ